MAQYINRLKVPDNGTIRHIVGFGQGDPGYDVLETKSRDNVPCVVFYYLKDGKKCSVSVTKYQGKYYVEYNSYNDVNSLISNQNRESTLRNVSREYLMETVMAYRAYRMLYNEYHGFRDDIADALDSGLECVYLGRLGKDREHLINLLERSGFHIESIDFDLIKTKEGICLASDGQCFNKDEIIP
ncbi:hypothetical protein FL966_04965 [Caproiciproducens galactitolivorans]|uniref:Uncharacterized protein n=1 Tax=Caproiciproducens galactitolivorans TaxID=642589 RepID=A0A4Z0YJF1_9FIRM|nr:hypothetical protein [Caproiciproducens galactitolivorans]QEY34456.1 hypothetical protein FL966_04965 [Caproiciproducens galactitolivorans]TGJ77766.1 hypothetical protein CAGA_01680 [Caproiciproducens galactitolivorans]